MSTEHFLLRPHRAPASGAGLPNVPAGLVRCLQCGEHNGTATFAPPAYAQTWEVEVICRCKGIVCRHCKQGAIHRPCSYTYHEPSGRVLRVAYYCWMARCEACYRRDGDGAIVFDSPDEPVAGVAPEQWSLLDSLKEADDA